MYAFLIAKYYELVVKHKANDPRGKTFKFMLYQAFTLTFLYGCPLVAYFQNKKSNDAANIALLVVLVCFLLTILVFHLMFFHNRDLDDLADKYCHIKLNGLMQLIVFFIVPMIQFIIGPLIATLLFWK